MRYIPIYTRPKVRPIFTARPIIRPTADPLPGTDTGV